MKLIIITALIGVCAALPSPQFSRNQYSPYTPQPPQYPQYPTNPSYYPQTRARAALDQGAAILRSTSDVNENGYHFAYDTSNGIQAEEAGQEANGIQAQGGYSYTGDDGQVYSVRYTAGDNGFKPEGAHIPTPPPLPPAIARALELNARDEAAGIFDDGSYHEGKYSSGVFAARSNFNYPQYQPGNRAPGFY